MKNAFKRCAVLLMALVMVVSMCGCGGTGGTTEIIVKNGRKCGTFTITGTVSKKGGTAKLSGQFPTTNNRVNYHYLTCRNTPYRYTVSGNVITFTRKSGSGPDVIKGYFDGKNTFIVYNATYCQNFLAG